LKRKSLFLEFIQHFSNPKLFLPVQSFSYFSFFICKIHFTVLSKNFFVFEKFYSFLFCDERKNIFICQVGFHQSKANVEDGFSQRGQQINKYGNPEAFLTPFFMLSIRFRLKNYICKNCAFVWNITYH